MKSFIRFRQISVAALLVAGIGVSGAASASNITTVSYSDQQYFDNVTSSTKTSTSTSTTTLNDVSVTANPLTTSAKLYNPASVSIASFSGVINDAGWDPYGGGAISSKAINPTTNPQWVSIGGANGTGSITFSLNQPQTALSFIWGSPNSSNTVVLLNAAGAKIGEVYASGSGNTTTLIAEDEMQKLTTTTTITTTKSTPMESELKTTTVVTKNSKGVVVSTKTTTTPVVFQDGAVVTTTTDSSTTKGGTPYLQADMGSIVANLQNSKNGVTGYDVTISSQLAISKAVFSNTSGGFEISGVNGGVSPVPVPAALPMFAAALVGLGGLARRRAKKVA